MAILFRQCVVVFIALFAKLFRYCMVALLVLPMFWLCMVALLKRCIILFELFIFTAVFELYVEGLFEWWQHYLHSAWWYYLGIVLGYNI